METKLENGETAFFDDAPWLVTNKRICSPAGVFRLSEVRSAEVVINENTINSSVWIDKIGWICALAGVMGGCIYSDKHNVQYGFDQFLVGVLFVGPGLLVVLLVKKLTSLKVSLNLHCTSGIHTLISRSVKVYKEDKANKDAFEKECAKMGEVKRAIGDALAAN
jgi:hypothetical protein